MPDQHSPPRVAAILVNWRAADMTVDAVRSLLKQTRVPDSIIVVDNGSGDNSDVRIADALRGEPRAQVLAHPDNRGFGSGCNLGISAAFANGSTYAWLINNDAEPDAECLSALLDEAAGSGIDCGAIGSLQVDPTGVTEPHFGSWMRPFALTCGHVESQNDLGHEFAWCTAASLLLSIDALRKVGGFDEKFFMYWEDADLAIRLRRAGYQIRCAANAQVAHTAGTSSAKIPTQRYAWHLDSQSLFLRKHHPRPLMALLRLHAKFLLKSAIDLDWPRARMIIGRWRRS